jgi:hypothetical protein
MREDGTVQTAFWDLAVASYPDEIWNATGREHAEDLLPAVDGRRVPVVACPAFEDMDGWAPLALATTFLSGGPDRVAVRLPGGDSLITTTAAGSATLAGRLDNLKRLSVASYPSDETYLVSGQIAQDTIIGFALRDDYDGTPELPGYISPTYLHIAATDDSYDDALTFWNRRAIRPRPEHWGRHHSILVTRATLEDPNVQNRIVEETGWTATGSPAILISSETVPEQELRSLATAMGLTEHDGPVTDSLLQPSNARTFAITVDPSGWWGTTRSRLGPVRDFSLRVERPTVGLAVPTPFTLPDGVCPARVTLSGETIVGPPRPAVAKLYLAGSEFVAPRQLVSTRAFNMGDARITVGVPTPAEILHAALTDRHVTFEPSDKARHIDGALKLALPHDLLGDPLFLHLITACTPKPQRDFRRTIDRLVEQNVLSADGEDRILAELLQERAEDYSVDLVFGKLKERFEPATAPQVGAMLERLVVARAANRGFRVICRTCDTKSFVSLRDAPNAAICLGCGSPAEFERNNHQTPRLRYKISSLMTRLSLNGGLPPLVAATQLLRLGAHVIPGANLKRDGQPLGETDVLGWHGNDLFTGESKVTAEGFTDEHIYKDVEMAAAIGANVHYMICGESIPSKTMDFAERTARAAGIHVERIDALATQKAPPGGEQSARTSEALKNR